jgi:hypothetical protein
MDSKHSSTWTTKNLVNFGMTLAGGFVPGMARATDNSHDEWTEKEQIQSANALGRGYNPGV